MVLTERQLQINYKASIAKSLQVKLSRVYDGDSVRVLLGKDFGGKNEYATIRLRWIDAPECPFNGSDRYNPNPVLRNQYQWGIKCKLELEEICQSDRLILNGYKLDVYNRPMGDLRLESGAILQLLLLQKGLAVPQLPLAKPQPQDELLYKKIGDCYAEAVSDRRGIWGDESFMLPYNFRQYKKTLKQQWE
jgi:endonuclease YncB( thermonuclease family)